jgi:hypothetical protein
MTGRKSADHRFATDFNDRAISQSSMTRTMSVNDQSFGVTPAASN